MGRLSFPLALFAYPFYLWKRSPGKEGSHFDPACDLFVPSEKNMVRPPHTHAQLISLGSRFWFATQEVCSQPLCAGYTEGGCVSAPLSHRSARAWLLLCGR